MSSNSSNVCLLERNRVGDIPPLFFKKINKKNKKRPIFLTRKIFEILITKIELNDQQ